MIDRRKFLNLGISTTGVGLFNFLSFETATAQKVLKKHPIQQKFQPRHVRHGKKLPAGEVHLFPDQFKLLWTLRGGRAIQYIAGIGRKNLYEPGTFFVGAKKEWPEWTPTPDMIRRQPKIYAKYRGGMPGGINNPLGARALYLFTKKRGDTFLRLHGTNNPKTIGIAVSNGCARLVNQHIVDLYRRVPLGTKVVLHNKRRV